MNGWFLASYIALWVLVAVLAVALLALYNHFGQMYMSSRAGRAAHGPAEGSALAPAEARDVLGTPVTIPVPGRDTLMVFTTTQCELCDELKPGLNRLAQAHPECAVLVICAGEREPVEQWGRDLPDPVLVPDRTSHIAARYGISLLPFLVMTSETGVVVTRGIVNSDQDLELALAIGRGDETDVVRVHTPIGGTT